MIKEQIAYQLVLNKLAGRPLTHQSDLGIKESVITKLILDNILMWHKGDYYTLTPEAQKWVISKHQHDKMINPHSGGGHESRTATHQRHHRLQQVRQVLA